MPKRQYQFQFNPVWKRRQQVRKVQLKQSRFSRAKDLSHEGSGETNNGSGRDE